MTLLLLMTFFVALAVLAPRFGVDSRNLDGSQGGPPLEDKLWSRQT